jgi:basic membrane lipoprotein Med (substrate-binding protein (PBP1-ABC) superfamily)
MTQRRAFLSATAGTGLLAASGLALGQAPVKAGFVYVSPIGDAGWTFQHDTGRKQMEQALKGKVETRACLMGPMPSVSSANSRKAAIRWSSQPASAT